MFVAKLSVDGEPRVGIVVDGLVHVAYPSLSLDDVLSHGTPTQVCETIVGNAKATIQVADADFLAPVGHQEIWAAGVTYTRSRQARMAEHGRVAASRKPLRPRVRGNATRTLLQSNSTPRRGTLPTRADSFR